MSKLYYIPLEIGAWVKDTSCVGMEVQGCLLNLIFKLWDSDDKGRLSISFSQLAILFKKTPEECKKIVAEIAENTLLNVEILPDGRVKFESRRMLKEAAKSLTLSANGKKGGRGRKANQKQTKSKLKAKGKQIPDYDYNSHSNYTIDMKGGAGGKQEPQQIEIPDTWPRDEFESLLTRYKAARKKKKYSTEFDTMKRRIDDLVKAKPQWSEAKTRLLDAIDRQWGSLVFEEDKTPRPQPAMTGAGYGKEMIRDKA